MTGGMPAGYSAALDEIYHLRQLLALEAEAAAVVLSYKTLPQGARAALERSVARMRAAVRGDTAGALHGWTSLTLQQMLLDADGSATLTRSQWEAGL